jgi:excisionase family DNA binding protein
MTHITDPAREGTTLEQPDMGYRLLRAQDVAAILQVSKSFVYALLEREEIPCVRLGRAVRVRHEAVMRYIEEQECPSHNQVPIKEMVL